MKVPRKIHTGLILTNLTAVLFELALASFGIAAAIANIGTLGAFLATGAFASLAAAVLLHAQMLRRWLAKSSSIVTQANITDDAHETAVASHDSSPVLHQLPALEESHEEMVPAAEQQPTTETVQREDTVPKPTLNLAAWAERLTMTADPLGELRLLVGDIRTREASGAPISPFEQFAARILSEAGLFEDDTELSQMRIVKLNSTKMFYLRFDLDHVSHLSKLRAFSIESALNAICLSNTFYDNPDEHELEEHYQLLQRLTKSICAQSPNLNEHVPVLEDEHPDTEWAVRMGISTAIESLRLPHRLTANWRVNVADGNVAIELDLPSEAVFPKTAYIPELGLVATSREMRKQAASDYALRLALLVAACTFRCSQQLRHVWIAGIVTTAKRRFCYLSVDFDRWRFSHLDLKDLGSLEETYHQFAPQLRIEEGALRPVRQSFSLEERRFCPLRRYENVGLSSRRLPKGAANSLGTDHVSGLAINESDKRRLIASDIMRTLTDSTVENVTTILELAGDDPDFSVRAAAERTIRKLIDGSLSNEPLAVGEEFVDGDRLSRAVTLAQQALSAQDAESASVTLTKALDPIDKAGIYADSTTVEWRYFPSYVTRTMYNLLHGQPERTLLLVPDAYFDAHLLLSVSLLAQAREDEALEHALRLIELSPLDTRGRLQAARCLEALNRNDEAIAMLCELLVEAHDPYSLGLGYYRMAFFQWQRGNLIAAQACYQRALLFMPAATPAIAIELSLLAMQHPRTIHSELSGSEAEDALKAAGVPIAPTHAVTEAFLGAARASLDAEVFPVARNFINILGALSDDDVLMGLIRSIEEEPDF